MAEKLVPSIRVGKKSETRAVGGSIAHKIRYVIGIPGEDRLRRSDFFNFKHSEIIRVQAREAPAINQAVKGIILANTFLSGEGVAIAFKPSIEGDKDSNSITFSIYLHNPQVPAPTR